MPQLLLELFSEEIPARMQAQAARDLERMAREALAKEGFLPEAMKSFAGPRRLTLVVEGLPPAQAESFAYLARAQGLKVDLIAVPGKHDERTGLSMLPAFVEFLRPRLEPYSPKN